MKITASILVLGATVVCLGCSSSGGSGSGETAGDAGDGGPVSTTPTVPDGGSADGSTPSSSTVTMCSLVTPAIATELLGAPVKKGPSNFTDYQCQYVGDAPLGAKEYAYQLSALYVPSSRSAFDTGYGNLFSPLSGVGEVARINMKTNTVKDGAGTAEVQEVDIVTFYKGWTVSFGASGANVTVETVTQQTKLLLSKLP